MIVVPVEKKIDWKRPPIVLILLVVLNILVFAFYQSDDQQLFLNAVEAYEENELINMEWEAYEAYASENEIPLELTKNDKDIAFYIVSDVGFDRFLEHEQHNYVSQEDFGKWQFARQEVHLYLSKLSSTALGFHSQDIKPLQLLSYQFLHGDFMHILGNMVFLILTGFAVEAAIGSGRFLAYYLLAGVGGALLYALFVGPGGGNLIGASGSISGVMGMYVMLFRARKIQFFYWLFVFTGYFKAAAIIMLPFYIGYELFNYFTDTGSNVAYTAHIGGFIVGSALVFVTQALSRSSIDEQYIAGKEEVDPLAKSIQNLYNLMAQCDFKQAWSMLKTLKKEHRSNPTLIEIEFNLVRALDPKKLDNYLLTRMGDSGNSRQLQLAQLQFWSKQTKEQKETISFSKKSSLLKTCLEMDALKMAENIFDSLKATPEKHVDVAVLARHLAVHCQSIQQADKSSKYNLFAQELARASSQEPNKNVDGAI